MPVLVPFIIGALSLGVATVTVLDGPVETLAVLLLALWIFLIGRRMISNDKYLPALLIPCVAPILLSVSSIQSEAWETGIFHLDAVVLEAMIGASCLVAWYLSKAHHSIFSFRSHTIDDLEHTAWIMSGLYGIAFIWLASHALVPEMGALFSVTIYVVIATCIYIVSRVLNASWKKLSAGVLGGLLISMALVPDARVLGTVATSMLYLLVSAALIVLAWLERNSFIKKRAWWIR